MSVVADDLSSMGSLHPLEDFCSLAGDFAVGGNEYACLANAVIEKRILFRLN